MYVNTMCRTRSLNNVQLEKCDLPGSLSSVCIEGADHPRGAMNESDFIREDVLEVIQVGPFRHDHDTIHPRGSHDSGMYAQVGDLAE